MHSVIAAANLVSEVSRFLSLSLSHTHTLHTYIHSLIVKENKKSIHFLKEKKKKKKEEKRGENKMLLISVFQNLCCGPTPNS
jgi:hypothetical protein